jgi:tetraacyldisaccharide 4'-kinase
LLGIARYILFPFALLYGGITSLRNFLFDKQILKSVRFDIPVISVGNLSVGGTGKTPHIEYLIRLLEKDYNLATLSRGYKRKTKGFVLATEATTAAEIGDEPMQFVKQFPHVAVTVSEDRLTGIPQLLLQKPDTQVILLDDAFQHRSVRPGLQILLTTYQQPFYRDAILPIGRLRECRRGYRRADMIIVTKCPPQLTQQEASAIQNNIQPIGTQKIFYTTFQYGQCYDFETRARVDLSGKKLIAVSGIANPEPFWEEIKSLGDLVDKQLYPDHHFFSETDIHKMHRALQPYTREEAGIVTTEKDAVRLELHRALLHKLAIKIYVLPIEVKFLFQGSDGFSQWVSHYVSTQLMQYQSPHISATTEKEPEV